MEPHGLHFVTAGMPSPPFFGLLRPSTGGAGEIASHARCEVDSLPLLQGFQLAYFHEVDMGMHTPPPLR